MWFTCAVWKAFLCLHLQARNKDFSGLFCLVSVRISAYPKQLPPHSLALPRTEFCQVKHVVFTSKIYQIWGVLVKGKKYYGDKYPQFINRVQSIRISKDEIFFFFFFPSQYSMLKLIPALSSLLVACIWCFMQPSQSYLSHRFLSQIPASATLLFFTASLSHRMGANGFNRCRCFLFKMERA